MSKENYGGEFAILSGLLDYLGSKPEVKDVMLLRGKPASISQIHSWEENGGCSLPEDLKVFFLTNSGLTLTWSYQYNGQVHTLGRININGLDELLPLGEQSQPILFSQGGGVLCAHPPTLNSLVIPPVPGSQPTPKFDGFNKIFTLDYSSSCGHVCLVCDCKETKDFGFAGEFWLLDLSLSWHFLASTFADYFRLAVVHLGLTQWPYALTRHGLSPQCERWFRLIIPNRFEMDLAQVCSAVNRQGSPPISLVDVSKIITIKPSKEKRSKTDTKVPR